MRQSAFLRASAYLLDKGGKMKNHALHKNFKRLILFLVVLLWVFYLPAFATDRIIDNGNGTATDIQKNLMWAIHDNGVPINWPDAQLYCKNYRAGGFADWRMPTLEELASLYNPKANNSKGYHTINQLYWKPLQFLNSNG